MTTDEIISMAGVDAMTLPGEVLAELSAMSADSVEGLEARSVFLRGAGAQTHPPAPSSTRLSYIDDKDKFYRNFTVNGRGKAKTEDVSKPTYLPTYTLHDLKNTPQKKHSDSLSLFSSLFFPSLPSPFWGGGGGKQKNKKTKTKK